MNLDKLGWTAELESYFQSSEPGSLRPGRVVAAFRKRYVVRTKEVLLEAEVTGNLRFSALNSYDFPAVGDWVSVMLFDHNQGIIHKVLPRKTKIERQAVGRKGEKQLIASNVDYSFIMQSMDRDFNINRLEIYTSSGS